MVLLEALPPYGRTTIPWLGPHGAMSFPRRIFTLFRSFSSGRSVGRALRVYQSTQGQRKALRRALLIGVNCDPSSVTMKENDYQEVARAVDRWNALMGPQKDAWDLSRLLIDVYGYDPREVTVLIDDNIPGNVQPTKDNIIQGIKDLVRDAAKGDQFFFHFAGHSTQMATNGPEEDDRKDELIVASDEQLVKDNDLNEYLVAPLPAGSSLVAIFDSCHSGTLLDLPHIRCNRVYVPWVSKVESLPSTLTTPPSDGRADVESPVDIGFPEQCQTQLPPPIYCTGWCRMEPPPSLPDGRSPVRADVITLSATKDGQRSWEDKEGKSMTQALIRILRKSSEPSLENLLTLVSHELHKSYLEIHDMARVYKEQVRVANEERQRKGKPPRRGVTVETDNFQDPQISSPKPLDMKRPWKI